jgi:hypothetical protein
MTIDVQVGHDNNCVPVRCMFTPTDGVKWIAVCDELYGLYSNVYWFSVVKLVGNHGGRVTGEVLLLLFVQFHL